MTLERILLLSETIMLVLYIVVDVIVRNRIIPKYQLITAKELALTLGIDYIKDAKGKELNSKEEGVNKVYARKGKYILLTPESEERTKWYTKINGKTELIIDNQLLCKSITNFDEILLQMIDLYTKYIDEDIFFYAKGFAIKLDGKICPDYHGTASIVFTQNTIQNDKVVEWERIRVRKYLIESFFCFIACFEMVVESNKKLKNALKDFYELLVEKDLIFPDTFFWELKDSNVMN